jgi:hypothetical protein
MYERKKTFFWEVVRPTVPAWYHTSSDRDMRPRYLLKAIIREKEGAWVGWEGSGAVRHGVG